MSLRGRITEHRNDCLDVELAPDHNCQRLTYSSSSASARSTRAASVQFDEARQEGPTGPLQLHSRVHRGTCPAPAAQASRISTGLA